jgi:hypothetical protein
MVSMSPKAVAGLLSFSLAGSVILGSGTLGAEPPDSEPESLVSAAIRSSASEVLGGAAVEQPTFINMDMMNKKAVKDLIVFMFKV